MEQQSNNDFDALFQRAAGEYPLKTDNKNWDVIANKLAAPSVLSNPKNKKWQYAALILLLLSCTFLLVNSLHKTGADSFEKRSYEQLTQKDKSAVKATNSVAQTLQKSLQENSNSILAKEHFSSTKISGPTINEVAYTQSISTGQKTDDQIAQIQSSNTSIEEKIAVYLNARPTLLQSQNLKAATTKEYVSQEQPQHLDLNNNTTQNLLTSNANNNIQKSEHIQLRRQTKTIYGTIYFAPGFSSIKFQKLSGPGYVAGISLGYHLDKRLSTEIGLQRMHTDFYSDGKYFDKSNSHLKPSYKIDALSGSNKLTEVPLTFRYKILKDNDHFYAGAGTNLALITHSERYQYSIRKNGGEKDVAKKYSSLTRTKFFSSINLNVGYQTSLYKICDVKIEPFYQASLKGVGIGNLPINTFGVSVGLVKDLK